MSQWPSAIENYEGSSFVRNLIAEMGIAKKYKSNLTIDKLSDKVLLHTFSFLPHKQIMQCTRVCKKWRTIASDPRLWQCVSLRPDYDGLLVKSIDDLLGMISARFGPCLRLIELPMELIQASVLHELANKCPKLQYLTLDFSTAVQLHDFNDLQSFPARLKSLTICLSEVIFLEGFIKRVYTYISSIEVLHLVGTFEKIEDEEEEVYEVINVIKLKQHTPNLKIVNFWGVGFINDEHLESLSTNCAQLECICVCFCQKVKGQSLKLLLQRCRRIKTLLMEQCLLDSRAVQEVEWEKTNVQELNITATELSEDALKSLLGRLPHLRWLKCGFLEHFTDAVVMQMLDHQSYKCIECLDLDTCDSLTEGAISELLNHIGPHLKGLGLGGIPKLTEGFWTENMMKITGIYTLIMGIAEDCCQKVTAKIHIDQFIESMSLILKNVERIEIRWDPDTLRFSDKSTKFIDMLRMRCVKLQSMTLSDGRYFEMMRSNFERADRKSVVRTTNTHKTSLVRYLQHYQQLLFN